MKKLLIIGVILIVGVVGVGAYVLLSSLDSVVKTAVEQIGSDATGTKVTLNEVEISPISGYGALRGFRMTNPQGFAEGDAFKFDEISLTIDVMTILSDPVVIKEIVIAKPEITYAIGKSSGNLDEIEKNVNDYAGAEDSGSGGGGGSSEGPKIIIENLYMRDGTVMVSAPAMTDETLSAPLPDIHLTDIGKDGGGATPAEVASQVMAAIAASAKQAVQSVDVDALLKGAGEMAGEAQEELEKATEGAGGAASEALDDATEGLKKLLE
jgi:uncharacterized protein involved in outer membrane biogenesis